MNRHPQTKGLDADDAYLMHKAVKLRVASTADIGRHLDGNTRELADWERAAFRRLLYPHQMGNSSACDAAWERAYAHAERVMAAASRFAKGNNVPGYNTSDSRVKVPPQSAMKVPPQSAMARCHGL